MKIGVLQFAPVLGDPSASLRKVEEALGDLAQIDLLILPELCNSGYNFRSRQEAFDSSEVIGEGLFSEVLPRLCGELTCHMVAGINERVGDRLYNTAVLFGPGRIIGKYRKLHLYLNEPDFFEPGDAPPDVFDVKGAKVSMLVCFDWAFPEVWRIAALAGAEIICHPSNIVMPERALKGLTGHALCNRVYIATANRIGTEGDLTFGGMSTILSPAGDILTQAPRDSAATILYDVDTAEARNKFLSPRNNLFEDRRPDVYSLSNKPKEVC